MVWTVRPRPEQVTPVGQPTPAPYIPKAKMGAPEGVATLDAERKIPREQLRMAPETAARLAVIDQRLGGVTGVQPGTGLKCIGGEFRLAIDQLPKG